MLMKPAKTLAMCGLIALFAAGCQTQNKKKDVAHGEQFAPEDVKRSPAIFAEAHTAAGARSDATLTKIHFNGGALNSLGRTKLDQMLAGTGDAEAFPLVVYMNVPQESPQIDARRRSVTTYLKDRGVNDSQVKFVAGPNPETYTPAAEQLSRLPRTESQGGGAGSPAETATPTAAPSGSMRK